MKLLNAGFKTVIATQQCILHEHMESDHKDEYIALIKEVDDIGDSSYTLRLIRRIDGFNYSLDIPNISEPMVVMKYIFPDQSNCVPNIKLEHSGHSRDTLLCHITISPDTTFTFEALWPMWKWLGT